MKYIELLKDAWAHWTEDKCARLGAALAYYAIFSIAPLLIIAFAVISMVFGDQAPQALMTQIQQFVGPTAAQAIAGMVSAGSQQSSGLVPAIIGVVTMLVGAAGLFVALQDALNTIWGVGPDPKAGWGLLIRNRLQSFAMVLVALLILFASLVASAVIVGVSTYVGEILPIPGWTMEAVNLAISFGVVTVLFAMIYRMLPDVEIAWGDVWVGAAITALLFVLGKFALGLYLGRSSIGSAFGAAGSLVVLLVWVYYAAQIFLFGAEYTQAYANKFGSRFKTSEQAVPLGPEALSREGIPPRKVYDAASNEVAALREAERWRGEQPGERKQEGTPAAERTADASPPERAALSADPRAPDEGDRT